MVLVYFSDRDYQFARLDIELAGPEGLVQPELFQCDFAASLRFSLIFTAFVSIYLDCRFGSAMFEFDLHSHCPAFSEVVSEVQCDMGKVETAMRFVVLIGFRITVAVEMLAIEIP